ncbi:MAG: TIGR04222 domain-containing membrane protein, partial [Burkholderiaceae bacterium]
MKAFKIICFCFLSYFVLLKCVQFRTNPFGLYSFDFLAFYIIVGWSSVWIFRWAMSRDVDVDDLNASAFANDAYKIAFLRAGENEAVKIATSSLIDRGLLQFNGGMLKTRDANAIAMAQRPIEQAILQQYRAESKYDPNLYRKLHRVFDAYTDELSKHQLFPASAEKFQRFVLVLLLLSVLGITTIVKIHIAFSQGRHNVLFLIILTAFFCLYVLNLALRRQSARGEALLADLQFLFARLKSRAHTMKSGGATNEAALVAAIF